MNISTENCVKRNIISTEFLNDTTLLVISQNEGEEYPLLSINYEKYNEVHTKELARISPDIKIKYNEKMIAIFDKSGRFVPRYKLMTVYDTENHEYIGESSKTLHYEAIKHTAGVKVKTLTTAKQ